jgi:hypothetical protein
MKDLKAKPVKEVKVYRGIPISGLWGIGMLFVCISIGYANYLVYFGTDDWLPKLMIVPSTIFIAYFLVTKAIK